MSFSVFVKMSKEEGSLERLLERVRSRGCQVQEMSAKCSLDNTYFFIRLWIEGSGSPELLRRELSELREVAQLDIDAPQAAAAC